MKKVGLPVAPTVRKLVGPRNRLVITDLKTDGSEIYDGHFMKAFGKRPRPEIDKIFLQLTSPENFPAIEKRMNYFNDIANQNNIILPTDKSGSFALAVKPDGSWSPILLDLILGETDYKKVVARTKTCL